MSTTAPRRLGDLLVQRGYLSEEQLQTALDRQRQGGRSRLLGEILVDLEYCSEDQIVECLATEYGVPYAKLEARLYDPKTIDVLPREYIENNLVLPLFIVRGVLTPGTALDETELASRFGVSRTPVREAIGRLVGEGYVKREGGMLTVSPVSVEDILEILTVRRAVEGEAAEIAAGRCEPALIANVRAAVTGMLSPADVTPERHWSVDDLVHLTIARATIVGLSSLVDGNSVAPFSSRLPTTLGLRSAGML